MYHTLILAGNVGLDPEMRYTSDGKSVTTFPVAVSDGFGERKKTIWFRVTTWEKQAETCNNYLKKGAKVLVEGVLSASDDGNPVVFERSDGTSGAAFEVRARTVRFLSPGERQSEGF